MCHTPVGAPCAGGWAQHDGAEVCDIMCVACTGAYGAMGVKCVALAYCICLIIMYYRQPQCPPPEGDL